MSYKQQVPAQIRDCIVLSRNIVLGSWKPIPVRDDKESRFKCRAGLDLMNRRESDKRNMLLIAANKLIFKDCSELNGF